MALFRAQAPEIDIVITTALIPGRPAPKLWPAEMVALMKPGSVVVDLAAEQGGNCDLTVADQIVTSDNGREGRRLHRFPEPDGQRRPQDLYATNIRHMLNDLTPKKDGTVVHNMEDDVIRGATIAHEGSVTFPPPPPKVQAIAAKPKEAAPEKTAEELRAEEVAAFKKQTKNQVTLLACGTMLLLLVGTFAPASFMQHFIVLFYHVCRISSYMERISFTSYSFDGCYKCYLKHSYNWCFAANEN